MSRYIKVIGLLAIALLLSTAGFAQIVRGSVKDSTGKAVAYASVNLKNSLNNSIISFAVTDSRGAYILQIPANAPLKGLVIEARCIGYKTQDRPIPNAGAAADFILAISINQLQAVVVKSSRPVLRVNGDTLGYKVSDFANGQDRVIGDVIKKLPGISVATDGTISYNGKAISNLYIGGDNLLDDKYNIATTTIPQGAVDQVQVIQNDQPIKMLQGKVVSEDVALNLTIKKGAKLQLVGQESAGGGIPGNYDVDLNAMMFKDSYKAINYLKGNNVGDDVANDLISHNLTGFLQNIDNTPPSTVLSLGSVPNPNLLENRYLFNQAALLNANNLVNIKKGEQLRVNLYYLHDTQQQDYSQQTQIYLPGDTVKYSETEKNRYQPNILHAQFTLNINKDKYYLNDKLTTDYSAKTYNSSLNTNGVNVNQVLNDNTLNFSNELDYLQSPKSGNIFEVYSYIYHISEPENRIIEPNFNPAVFNNGVNYNQLAQSVNIPTWFTNNYLSFKIPSNFITQTFKAGFLVQSQTLQSNLSAVQLNGTTTLTSDSAMNNLNWTRKKVYAGLIYDLPGDILKANLSLPLSLQQVNYGDSLYNLNKSLTRLYFNPRLFIKYMVSVENYFTFLYNYRNDAGSIQDVYRGYILTDYNTYFANNADLTLSKNQMANFGFNYRKALTLFFFSINASLNHIQYNNITSELINDDFQQRVVLPYPNATNAWTINGFISKYSFALRTTFSGGVQWQANSSNQVENNTLLPFNTISTTINAGIESKVTDQVTLSYKTNWMQTSSTSPAELSNVTVRQLIQQAAINYEPAEDVFFKLSGDDYLTYQQGNNLKYFFADASVKFRITQLKSDVELSALNFLNVKNYSYLNLSANTFTASSYRLPGRIVMVKVMFNL